MKQLHSVFTELENVGNLMSLRKQLMNASENSLIELGKQSRFRKANAKVTAAAVLYLNCLQLGEPRGIKEFYLQTGID